MTNLISIVLSFSLAVGGNSHWWLPGEQEYSHTWKAFKVPLLRLYEVLVLEAKAAYCLLHWRTVTDKWNLVHDFSQCWNFQGDFFLFLFFSFLVYLQNPKDSKTHSWLPKEHADFGDSMNYCVAIESLSAVDVKQCGPKWAAIMKLSRLDQEQFVDYCLFHKQPAWM